MLEETVNLDNILSFLGYGEPLAKIWFVGGEEGFGGRMTEEEKVASLRTRAGWSPIRDMYEAHLELSEQGQKIDISKKRAGSIGVWLWMSRITLALHNQTHSDKADREYVYRKDGLGRSNGMTFLTELSPLPSAQSGKPHPMVAHLSSRPQGERIARLRNMRKNTTPLTICYGLGRKDAFADMLGCDWDRVESIPDPIYWDKCQRAFLLPFFGQGQMSYARLSRFLNSAELRSVWNGPETSAPTP